MNDHLGTFRKELPDLRLELVPDGMGLGDRQCVGHSKGKTDTVNAP